VTRLVVQPGVEVALEVRLYDYDSFGFYIAHNLTSGNNVQNLSYIKSPYSLKRVRNTRRYEEKRTDSLNHSHLIPGD